MKLYISGGITKEPNFRVNFRMAEAALQAAGYETVNPLDVEPQCGRPRCQDEDNHHSLNGITHPHSYECLIRWDVSDMLRCDGVALITGWTTSFGSLREAEVARIHFLPVASAEEWIREAAERQSAYNNKYGITTQTKETSS